AADQAFSRLDDAGMVDVLEISTLMGRRPEMFALHRQVLDGNDTVRSLPFNGYFANVKLTSYEGGLAYTASQSIGHSYVGGTVTRSHAVARHPRTFLLELKRLKQLQDSGCTLAVRYTLDYTVVISGLAVWYDFPGINTQVGTGDPAENANPYDLDNLVS